MAAGKPETPVDTVKKGENRVSTESPSLTEILNQSASNYQQQ
jgi:hypothetical protein